MIYFGDVDVILKLAECGILPMLPYLLDAGPEDEFRRLASLRVWGKLLPESAKPDFHAFCDTCPSVGEAEDIERWQELRDAHVDPGEAILFAEAETFGGFLITGDRNALRVYKRCSTADQRSKFKVILWEMLLLRVREKKGFDYLREKCCTAIDGTGQLSKDNGFKHMMWSQGRKTKESDFMECIASNIRTVSHSQDILHVFS